MSSVKSTIAAYFDALHAGDAGGIAGTFAADGSLMGHEMETLSGQDQIRQTFTGIFKNLSFQRELHIDHIDERGDFATVQSHTTGTITVLASKNNMPVVSRELFVLRKDGGDWRITEYMFNRTAPAPAPAP